MYIHNSCVSYKKETMKFFLTIVFLAFSVASFGQGLTFEDWQKESQQNKRLLPKYGEIKKTKKEKI